MIILEILWTCDLSHVTGFENEASGATMRINPPLAINLLLCAHTLTTLNNDDAYQRRTFLEPPLFKDLLLFAALAN